MLRPYSDDLRCSVVVACTCTLFFRQPFSKQLISTNPCNRGLYSQATCLVAFRKISLFENV